MPQCAVPDVRGGVHPAVCRFLYIIADAKEMSRTLYIIVGILLKSSSAISGLALSADDRRIAVLNTAFRVKPG
jgi:hypothetical protein